MLQTRRPPRTRRRGRLAAVCAAAIAVVATAACGSPGTGGGGSAPDSTLVVYTGQAGDYQLNFNPYSPTVLDGPGTIFEPLFYYNLARKGDPTPLLGTEHSWNDAGTELSVTLREGVKWSDGTPFTAKDVVFTLDMVTKHKALNGTGYNGAAKAVDDTHVTITFPEPAYMQGPQVLGRIWIVPEHLWKNVADPTTDVVNTPVGTGAFLLDEFKPQAFTLKANPGYWGGEPAVKRVRYLSLSGNQAGADALAAGKIDWQTGPVPDMRNFEKNHPGYKLVTTPMNQMALFTCSNAALGCTGAQTDPAVRKAIYHGMNRAQLKSLAFEDTASEISPGFARIGVEEELMSDKLVDRLAPMEPQVDKAVRSLESAGYAKGADGVYAKGGKPLAFAVKVPTGWTDYITAVDTMAQQLLRVGIKLTPQQVSWNEWSDARARGTYEILIDSLYPGPAPDPYYLYNYFFATETTAPVGQSANPNFSRFSDPQVDAALAALEKIDPEDAAAREPHLDAIQTRIEAAMPYIPILTGGTSSEYNAEKFDNWPSKDDLYAYPAVWGRPDHSQIFKSLKPAGS